MVKTSVKFQKNQSKTVGGVAHTRYILYRGKEGRKDARTDGRTDGQTDERNDGKPKTMSLRFSSKRRGQQMERFLKRRDYVDFCKNEF